jgi:hypothetical protein
MPGLSGFPDDLHYLLQLLQTRLIDGIALFEVITEALSRPDAKAGTLPGIDPVADGDDGVEVVKPDVPGDRPVALLLNYREILGSCLWVSEKVVLVKTLKSGNSFIAEKALFLK